jgi:hypothetical protein
MLIRTRKATCGWIKPVAEGGCFGVLNGSPNWEKRREVFLVFTGSKSLYMVDFHTVQRALHKTVGQLRHTQQQHTHNPWSRGILHILF